VILFGNVRSFSKNLYVVYVYESHDSKFDEFQDEADITFIKDIFGVDNLVIPGKVGLIVFDKIVNIEQNNTAAQYLTQFFVYSATHENLIPIFLCHNLFSKSIRTLSLNAANIVLFKTVRDRKQISVLASQLGVGSFLSSCLDIATKTSDFGYILIDLTTTQKERFRYRNFIWPTESANLIFTLAQ
jgi:hypothetical protein